MQANDLPPMPALWRAVPRARVLVFAPHPDDEVCGPGGALALHRRQGDAVRVVVATDGTSGDPEGRFDPARYPQQRRAESRQGLAELGVDDVAFWGFPDSCVLSEADLERAAAIATAAVRDFQPGLVYLPWRREGHPDHHALFTVVTRALARATFAGLALGYEVWNAMIPDVVVDISPVMEQKRRAMLAHHSQLAYTQYDHSIAGLNAYRSLQHLQGRGYGEAFVVVAGTPPLGFAGPGTA
ncbi:MAG: PIG-L family deacetylase [Planctomycetes bacterium]|nr:PIG-L family deacetylase [Planctomycetota bacterium]